MPTTQPVQKGQPQNGNSNSPAPEAKSMIIARTAVLKDKKRDVNTRLAAVRDILETSKGQILAALPKHVSQERMIRLFLSEVRKNPKLLDCTPESLFASLTQAGSLGLETDGVLGDAYLVPFKNEVVLIPGYKGLLKLARRHSKIIIKTRCVYKGDTFSYAEGDEDFINHVPNQSPDATFQDADITHVYLVARDSDGKVICRNVWTRAQVDAHARKYSKSYNRSDSPWKTDWPPMARKTLIRDSINRGEIPVSVEVQRLSMQDETIEAEFARRSTEVMSGPTTRLSHDPSEASDQIADMLGDEGDDGTPAEGDVIEGEAVESTTGESQESDADSEYEQLKSRIVAAKDEQSLSLVSEDVNEAYGNGERITFDQSRTLRQAITRKLKQLRGEPVQDEQPQMFK